MHNSVTFDLEDYFHVSAYAQQAPVEAWDSYPSRVEESTSRILDLLAEHDVCATFFVLGWVAEKKPAIVKKVAAAGHEIACHSLLHRKVFDLTSQQFREDTRRSKAAIEQVSGCQVIGYRAPSFSITSRSIWALEILVEEGFLYDSSIFPVKHISYGVPTAPRTPFTVETSAGKIIEFPMPTLKMGARRAPVGGGAYLRLLPYAYTHWALNYLNQRERLSACIYLHPWELDPDQPRMKGSLTAAIRHRYGLREVERKLTNLLRDFKFRPLGSFLKDADIPLTIGEASLRNAEA